MKDFLESFGPVNRILQSRDLSYSQAMPLIEVLQSKISDFRSDVNFTKYVKKTDELLANSAGGVDQPIRRNRQRSKLLEGFVVEDTIGERSNADDDIKATYFEIIDVATNEMKDRFFENNEILSLSNSSNIYLKEIKPLEKLSLYLPSEHEMNTAKKFIEKKNRNSQKKFRKPMMAQKNIHPNLIF